MLFLYLIYSWNVDDSRNHLIFSAFIWWADKYLSQLFEWCLSQIIMLNDLDTKIWKYERGHGLKVEWEEFIIKFQFSITTTNVLSLFPLLFHFRVHQPQSVMQINFGALCRLQRFFVFALQKKQRANLIAWECISSIFFFHFFVFFSSSLNRT